MPPSSAIKGIGEYARKKGTNEWVKAQHATREFEYECPCIDRHRVFPRKPSGIEGRRPFKPHFFHNAVRGSDGKLEGSCRGGGESQKHLNAKLKLRDMQGQYYFATERCTDCKKEKLENCSDGVITVEQRSECKKYRYDAFFKGEDGREVALEVLETHATTTAKIQDTLDAGKVVAEFMASEINDMEEGEQTKLDNLLVHSMVCDDCQAERERRRIAFELRLERERVEKELRLERERVEKEQRLQRERVENEQRLERERVENELRLERERVSKEQREERERFAKEQRLEKEARDMLMLFDASPSFGPSQSLCRSARFYRVKSLGYAMPKWDWVEEIFARFPELAAGKPAAA